MVEEDFVKIVIDLPAAEDGVGGEGIWSVKVGEDLYEVPVRAGLVKAPELYPYSSAYRAKKPTSGAEATSLPEPLRHG
jgi:hypothetical protein